eukprot:bmy_08389T0
MANRGKIDLISKYGNILLLAVSVHITQVIFSVLERRRFPRQSPLPVE